MMQRSAGIIGARPGYARQSALLHAFLAAPIVYLMALIGLPIVYNIVMSFQDVSSATWVDFARPWVGLDNYRAAIDDPVFAKVAVNSIVL